MFENVDRDLALLEEQDVVAIPDQENPGIFLVNTYFYLHIYFSG